MGERGVRDFRERAEGKREEREREIKGGREI
jgi:hypothetical protein